MPHDRAAIPTHAGGVLSPTAGAAIVIASVFAGSTWITPLYPLYREHFGFSEITLTLVYSVYVVGNLAALVLFGRLSDQIGRRRVVLAAIAVAAASTLLFLFARTTAWLFWARALNGFAVGCASGTATAWLADVLGASQSRRASVLATSANFAGIAVGPLIAGPLVQYVARPLQLPHLIYLGVLAVTVVIAARTPETISPAPLGDVSLRPRLGVPRRLRARFVAPAVTGFAVFGLVGFYAALVPSFVLDTLGERNRAIGAAIVAELFVAAVIAIVATTRIAGRTAMRIGLILLVPSAGLLVVSELIHALAPLLAASALSGVASALGYRGSVQLITELAPDDQRAEVVSTFYVVCFASNAILVIGVGLVSAAWSSLIADVCLGAVIAVFAVAALIISWRVGDDRRGAR